MMVFVINNIKYKVVIVADNDRIVNFIVINGKPYKIKIIDDIVYLYTVPNNSLWVEWAFTEFIACLILHRCEYIIPMDV